MIRSYSKQRSLKAIAAIALLHFVPGEASAEDIPQALRTGHVRNKAELSAAIARSRPGDHIVLKSNANWSGLKITVNRNGTEANPIVLKAENIGGVKITGTSKITVAGKHIILHGLLFTKGRQKLGAVRFTPSSSHCRMTRCTVTDLNKEGDKITDCVYIEGAYNRVDHCFLSEHKCKGRTIAIEGNYPNYHRIDHNHFVGMPKTKIQNKRESIKMGSGGGRAEVLSRTVVEYNLFEKCDADGENISVKSDENTVRYNTFINHKGGHLTNRSGDRTRIEGNLFLNNGLGMRIYGEDHVIVNNYFSGGGTGIYLGIGSFKNIGNKDYKAYNEPVNTLIAHNTFCDLREAFKIGVGNGLPPENTRILNNVVKGAYIERINSNTRAFWIAEKVKDITYSGNVIYQTSDKPNSAGITLRDPMLTKNQFGILQLNPESPCVDGCTGGPIPTDIDIKGDERNDKRRDTGCEEYYAGSMIRPLTAEDVGPFSN